VQKRELSVLLGWEASGGHWLDFKEVPVSEQFVFSDPPTPEHAMPAIGEVALATLERAGIIPSQLATVAESDLVASLDRWKGMQPICALFTVTCIRIAMYYLWLWFTLGAFIGNLPFWYFIWLSFFFIVCFNVLNFHLIKYGFFLLIIGK